MTSVYSRFLDYASKPVAEKKAEMRCLYVQWPNKRMPADRTLVGRNNFKLEPTKRLDNEEKKKRATFPNHKVVATLYARDTL
jgi:hypothetical protein